MLITQAKSTHSLAAVITGQKTLIHSVMKFEAIQTTTEEHLQQPTFQQTWQCRVRCINNFILHKPFHTIFNTSFVTTGKLDGRNTKT